MTRGTSHSLANPEPAALRLQLFEALAGQLTDAVVITEAVRGRDGHRILWVNDAWERMTGYSASEIAGKTPKILQGPRTSQQALARIAGALEACRAVEAELVNYRKDGSPFWTDIRISPVFGEDGRCTHFVGVKRDTTDRKVRETLDRLRSTSLRLIADAAPLEDVLAQIAAMVESQSPQAAVSVYRIADGRLYQIAAGPREAGEPGGERLEDAPLGERALRMLDEGRPVACRQLPAAASCRVSGLRCKQPCVFYPIRSSWGECAVGLVRARADESPWLDVLVLQAIAEAAQLAEVAFKCDADRRHLEHLANHDPLTNLPNRTLLSARMEREVAAADRHAGRFALAVLDLDSFKRVNDDLGHAAGDAVLREAAERLRFSLRADDTLARIGGDEFVLLLHGVTSRGAAERAVRRTVAALEQPFEIEGRRLKIEASFGLAVYPDDSTDSRELFQLADLQMYARRAARRQRGPAHIQGELLPA